jgi:hypothetical protein
VTRSIDDWRRWIAENLLLGATPPAVHAALLQQGFNPAEATLEINTALASPYLQGGTRMRNRLRKRDWTLSVYGQLSRMRESGGAVERCERLSRDEFFEHYYFQNRPVIITGAFDSWPARTQWNFDYFRARCGDCEVEVQFGRNSDPNYEINQPNLKRIMPFREYVDLVERSGATNGEQHHAKSRVSCRVVGGCADYSRVSRSRVARYGFFLVWAGRHEDAVSP